jgi:hypothetical protein
LTRAHKELFADTRFGVAQSDLRSIFNVYDEIAPGESKALTDLLGYRTQSVDRVADLVQSFGAALDRVTLVLPGATMTNLNSTITIQGSNSGPINVAGTFTNNGTIISSVGDQQLQAALTSLNGLAKQLADKLPDDQKEAIANKAEALTKAAAASKPDKSMIEFTGKGLVEAAKSVAEMAAPIATAVGAILGIFGLGL